MAGFLFKYVKDVLFFSKLLKRLVQYTLICTFM